VFLPPRFFDALALCLLGLFSASPLRADPRDDRISVIRKEGAGMPGTSMSRTAYTWSRRPVDSETIRSLEAIVVVAARAVTPLADSLPERVGVDTAVVVTRPPL
jgi:hypothetical protein